MTLSQDIIGLNIRQFPIRYQAISSTVTINNKKNKQIKQ